MIAIFTKFDAPLTHALIELEDDCDHCDHSDLLAMAGVMMVDLRDHLEKQAD